MATLISLSPNAERDDIRLALHTLVRPWTWTNADAVVKAKQAVSGLVPNTKAVLASSGRTAIAATLAAAGIGEGDEVIVQAFTCVAVPGAVKWTGARAVFVDIDPTTFNMDVAAVAGAIGTHTKAIIVQHTFGISGPTAQLRDLADAHGLLLIEDMAHSLRAGAAPLTGHVGILSFGRDKIISSVFGGAVVSNDATLLTKIERAQAALPLPPRRWVAQQLLHPPLMAIVKRWYFMGLGKWILVAAQRLRLLSKAVALGERAGESPVFDQWRYSPALALLLTQQVAKLDTFTRRRITAVNQYADRIAAVHQWRPLPLLRVPLRVKEKTELLLQARSKQLLLGDWYRVAVEPCSLEQLELVGYVPGSCQHAETAAREVINLPTHPTMHPTEAQQVINFLREHGNISS